MSGLLKRAWWWRAAFIRGGLWVCIAMGTTFLEQLSDLTKETVAGWFWADWTKLTLVTLLSGLITIRTFLDQTVARHTGVLEDTLQKPESK